MAQQSELSFLPDDYLERKAQRRTNAICAVMFLAVMGGVGTAFTLSEKATRQTEGDYARVEEQYLNEAKRLEQVRQMQEKQKRMNHQAELTASLLEKVPKNSVLAEITNALPAGMSLMDFSLDSRVRAKPAAAEPKLTAYEQKKLAQQKKNEPAKAALAEPKVFDVSMKLTGFAMNDEQVAQYLKALARSPLFKDVNLIQTEEFTQKEEKVRKFQMELMLDPAADAHALAKDVKQTQTTAVELKD